MPVTFIGDISILEFEQVTLLSNNSNIEILNSARIWTDDYDCESVKLINE